MKKLTVFNWVFIAICVVAQQILLFDSLQVMAISAGFKGCVPDYQFRYGHNGKDSLHILAVLNEIASAH